MARKSKLRRGSVAERNLQQIARRELSKGNAKQALKDAKICHRKDPTPESLLLLQQAFLARIDQLSGSGLEKEAGLLWHELIRFGDMPPELKSAAARRGVLLGIAAGRDGAVERDALDNDPHLACLLADQALLDPRKAQRCPPPIRQDVEKVRCALEAVERDDVDAAPAALETIGRGSPCAEWKLFARGLIGYYADDAERMLENWSRLDPQRPAHRIAESLLVLAGERRSESAPPVVQLAVERLTRALESGLILGDLGNLIATWREDDWKGIQRNYRRLVQKHGQAEPEIVQQVTDILWRRFVKDDLDDRLDWFLRYAPPLPLDPRWNRVRGLLADRNDWVSLNVVEDAWNAYAEDLRTCTALKPQERGTAVALVMCHLARQFVKAADDEISPFSLQDQPYIRRLRRAAAKYFERSQESDPSLREVYFEYADLSTDLRQPRRADRLYQELFRRFPDDFDVAVTIAWHYINRRKYGLAKPAAHRAIQLRARDAQARTALWAACLGAARDAALAGQFTVARAELDEAQPLVDESREAYLLEAHRAAVEFRAQNAERAWQHVEAAQMFFDQPAAGLLVVCAQVGRYRVDRDLRDELNARLTRELAGACTSQAAGAMARFIESLIMLKVNYREFVTHQRQVVNYVVRCVPMCWQTEDLTATCALLGKLPKCKTLRKKLVRVGQRLFPEDPHYPFFQGELQMSLGPHRTRLSRIRMSLKRALELSERAERPLRADFQELAKRAVSFLDSARDAMPHMVDAWD